MMVAKEEFEVREIKSDGGEVVLGAGEEDEEAAVLPGFRFHPTDEELLTFYLRRKTARKGLCVEVIRELDIYKYDPWDLPKARTVDGGEKEWYFFCLRGRKYRNSIRPNRVTGSGFWKATGIDRPIYSAAAASSGDSIGLKKSLVYYRGTAGKGTKTDWMMHEFRLPPPAAASPTTCGVIALTDDAPLINCVCGEMQEVWTICRIFRRNIMTYRKQPWKPAPATAGETSSTNTGSFESDGGDEHMNRLAPRAGAPPVIHPPPPPPPQHANTVNGGSFFFRESMHAQQFQCQWNTAPAMPVLEQRWQNPSPSTTTAAFHQNDHSLAATNYGYLEEIARMMEITDQTSFYDCTYA